MRKLTKAHFYFFSTWEKDLEGGSFTNGETQYLVDKYTHEKYLNDDPFVIRVKCIGLSAITPIVHGVLALYRLGFHLFQLLTHSFCYMVDNTPPNLLAINQDIANIFFIIPSVLLLECAALFGVFSPLNGRKLYANLEQSIANSMELIEHTEGFFAPCFQPKPEDNELKHLFGGNINHQNAW